MNVTCCHQTLQDEKIIKIDDSVKKRATLTKCLYHYLNEKQG